MLQVQLGYFDHRSRVLQSREIARIFAEVSRADYAAHYFSIAGLGQSRYKVDLRRGKGLSHVLGDEGFQLSFKSGGKPAFLTVFN